MARCSILLVTVIGTLLAVSQAVAAEKSAKSSPTESISRPTSVVFQFQPRTNHSTVFKFTALPKSADTGRKTKAAAVFPKVADFSTASADIWHYRPATQAIDFAQIPQD